jgi:hypothetical protein
VNLTKKYGRVVDYCVHYYFDKMLSKRMSSDDIMDRSVPDKKPRVSKTAALEERVDALEKKVEELEKVVESFKTQKNE